MVKSGARCGQEEEARNPVQESKWSIKVSGHGSKGGSRELRAENGTWKGPGQTTEDSRSKPSRGRLSRSMDIQTQAAEEPNDTEGTPRLREQACATT